MKQSCEQAFDGTTPEKQQNSDVYNEPGSRLSNCRKDWQAFTNGASGAEKDRSIARIGLSEVLVRNDGSLEFQKTTTDRSERPKKPEEKVTLESKGARDKESGLPEQRSRLENNIDSLADHNCIFEKQRSQFKADMLSFEDRARKQGLSDEEVAKTYAQISRLLEAQGNQPVSARQRIWAALDSMALAADPDCCRQGGHNTCNATTVENRIFTKEPSTAAGLIADVATSGEYVARDGTKVKLDKESLTIHKEEAEAPLHNRQENYRSYGSQLFQVTAINLLYAKENSKTNPPGNAHYVQGIENPPDSPGSEGKPDANPTGEKVMDGALVDTDYTHQKGGNLEDVCAMNTMIRGRYEPQAFLQREETVHPDHRDGNLIGSEQELEQQLAELKQKNQLPAVVTVNLANEPFHTIMQNERSAMEQKYGVMPGQKNSSIDLSTLHADGHFVNITDYNPETGKITFKNPNGQNSEQSVSVHDFYKAMAPAPRSIWFNRFEQAKDRIAEKEKVESLQEIASEVFKRFELERRFAPPGVFDEKEYDLCLQMYNKALKQLSAKDAANVRSMVQRDLDLIKTTPPEEDKKW